MLVKPVAEGMVLVAQTKIETIAKHAAETENRMVGAGGCTAIESPARHCAGDVEQAKGLATSLRAAVNSLRSK